MYIALLKFDFFFVFGTQLQVLLAMKNMSNHEFILQAAMIPVTIVILILGARFCRLEKRKSLVVVMVGAHLMALGFMLISIPDSYACHCGKFRHGYSSNIFLVG